MFAAWSGYFLAVSAFAGMKGQMPGHHAKIIADIKRRASNFPSNVTSEAGKNAPAPINGPEDSNELIGDLIGGGPYSEVGQEVANIIMVHICYVTENPMLMPGRESLMGKAMSLVTIRLHWVVQNALQMLVVFGKVSRMRWLEHLLVMRVDAIFWLVVLFDWASMMPLHGISSWTLVVLMAVFSSTMRFYVLRTLAWRRL